MPKMQMQNLCEIPKNISRGVNMLTWITYGDIMKLLIFHTRRIIL